MYAIDDDSDLPPCLDTRLKQAVWARKIVDMLSAENPAIATRTPPQDGAFSRTVIVTLQDKQDVVIQFRRGMLDTARYFLARQTLGAMVPEVIHVQDKFLEAAGAWIYWSPFIPGITWEAAEMEPNYSKVPVLRSLGCVLSKGFLEPTSHSAMPGIEKHLRLILASKDPTVIGFRTQTQEFLDQLHLLSSLPLFLSHHDLYEGNVIVGDDREVIGLIDWDKSTPLPFGMGFGRLHILAGEYDEGVFKLPNDYFVAEAAFWQGVWSGLPANVLHKVNDKLEVVQIALALGYFLEAFYLDEGDAVSSSYNPVIVRALKKLLTYRLLMLRSDGEAPYADDD
ncbi:hypothetical protein ANO11243_080430 [Dothideomycetidae sp. 11243]|nr:hypothetical protein ANO11243_080430 [fungal sp. No.11243]